MQHMDETYKYHIRGEDQMEKNTWCLAPLHKVKIRQNSFVILDIRIDKKVTCVMNGQGY